MKLISTTVLILLCSCFALKAQQLVNGSLEPHGSITPCTAGAVSAYNNNMSGAWASGSYTSIYTNDGNCSSGAAAAGNSYTGIRYTFTVVPPAQDWNTLVLKLDAPLVKDTLYKITLSYKLDAGSSYAHSNVILMYGYTHDSMSKDSASGSIGSISTTTWKPDTLKIKPKVNNMQYIWLEPAYAGAGSVLIYVDDLKIVHAASAVNNVNMRNNVRVYPNPVRDKVVIEVSEPIQLPCTISLRDISGREVMQQGLFEKTTIINKNDLNSGIYFMQLTDSHGERCIQKIIVE
jgi:hypothetical protein